MLDTKIKELCGKKIAIMSDMHSNYHAFRACYEDAIEHGADSFIFLGDYVSDLSESQKTLDLVYEIQEKYPTVCLRGNREGYMLDAENGRNHFAQGSKSGSLLYTYEHLRKKDIDFFKELNISEIIKVNGVQIEVAHAVMDNDRYYFDATDGHISEVFTQMKCTYLLTGHSHKQYIQEKDGKTIMNPGSVGIPQDKTKTSKYALLDVENGDVACKLCEVSYDMTEVICSQFRNGLMGYAKYWAIGILYDIITGEEWVLRLLKSVNEVNGAMDEAVWHKMASELGMKFTEQELLELYHDDFVMSKKKCKDS